MCGKVMAGIKYGEDDWPYLKEALRYYIAEHPTSHYHYKELFSLFESEPCILCTSISYEVDDFKRRKGKLICGKCCREDDLK